MADRAFVLKLAPLGGVCAEIGCWKGDFSAQILSVMKPRELHLVDPWRFVSAFPRRWYGGAIATSQADMDGIFEDVRIRFVKTPQVKIHRQASVAAARQFADETFDWIYIDGDHSRDSVLADLQVWHAKVKPGSFIVCDDYTWVDENNVPCVKAAIETFLQNTAVAHTYELHNQFVIRR